MNSSLSKEKQEILEAVKKGTLKNVKELIDSNGLEIDDETYFDYRLLKAAVKRKHKNVVNFLLEKNCRVKNQNDLYYTPLHYAVLQKDIKTVEQLLRRGASINDSPNEKTPLILAIKNSSKNDDYNSKKIVELMFKLYDFKNVHPITEQTLLNFYIACDQGFEDAIVNFVKCGLPVNSHAASSKFFKFWNNNTPLHFAVKNFRKSLHRSTCNLITYLMENGADYNLTNNKKQTPLHLAYYLKNNDTSEIIKIIFNHSLKDQYTNSVDNNGLNHFHICCAYNMPEVIEKFIEKREDINCAVSLDSNKNSGYTPLHFAVYNCHENIVNILLNHGANVSLKCKEGSTPLHIACKLGKIEITRLLLSFNAELTVQDNKGRIPLHYAFYEVPMDNLVSLLLAQTPNNINYTDSEGLSIFHIACATNNRQIVENFLEQGVSPNLCIASDNYKYPDYTPMHFAAEYNRKDIVQLLFKYGADINRNENLYENNRKITPLHLSCIHSHTKFYELCKANLDWKFHHENHTDIVKLLLQHKADVNAKDSLGKTPLVYLCELSNTSFIEDDSGWARYYSNNESFENWEIFPTKEKEDSSSDETDPYLIYKEEVDSSLDERDFYLNYYDEEDGFSSDEREEDYDLIEEQEDYYSATVEHETLSIRVEDYSSNEEEYVIEDMREQILTEVNKKIIDIARILVSYNVDLNACTDSGESILHVVTKESKWVLFRNTRVKLVKLFLENKANVKIADQKKVTPLHLAVKRKNIDLVYLFLNYNANINAKTVTLMTPLHLAAALHYEAGYSYHPSYKVEFHDKLVELLLKNGCTVNDQNLEKKTALHLAMSKLNYSAIKLLLCYGADINSEDASGNPPIFQIIKKIRGNCYRKYTIRKIVKYLYNHIEKLELIGLHTNDKSNELLSDLQHKYSVYNDESISFACGLELEKMKDIKIDQYTNLYNILFKDDIEMSRLVKNKNVKDILTDDQLENKFPLYGDMLKLRFRRGTEKFVILDNAKESLGYVTGFLLPDSCSERIFRYLTIDDLLTLIKVESKVSLKRKINYDPEESDDSLAKQIRLEE